MFRQLENDRPFLKAAFEGFAGDGKTFTAAKIAIGLHQHIKSQKPIAIFDTEKASKALKGLFGEAGIQVVVADSERSLKALSEAIKWCEAGGADILIVDSITHVWEEYLAAYMRQKRRDRLEFQDWGVIKPRWKAEFSTPFVNANVHIIFTGRAGYEYSQEVNESTGKKEIQKSGIKMKAETETAFEPDLLVLMEKVMVTLGENKSVKRVATILKDRTDQIDGKTFENPGFEQFFPAIRVLLDGHARPADMARILDVFEDQESNRMEWKRKREKAESEIEGVFAYMGLGRSTKDLQLKAAILRKAFGVLSLEKLDDLKVDQLNDRLPALKRFSENYVAYMADCAETQETPDNAHIANLLSLEVDDVVAAS